VAQVAVSLANLRGQPTSADALQIEAGVFGFIFFFVVVIIIVIGVARFISGGSRVQRPMSEATAFPPPPPPDTVMVKCAYCGTQQIWKETCVQCGAPLPKPNVP
jgi:hypothetical protein